MSVGARQWKNRVEECLAFSFILGRARNQKKEEKWHCVYSLIKRDIFIIPKHFSSELIFKGISNIIFEVQKTCKIHIKDRVRKYFKIQQEVFKRCMTGHGLLNIWTELELLGIFYLPTWGGHFNPCTITRKLTQYL